MAGNGKKCEKCGAMKGKRGGRRVGFGGGRSGGGVVVGEILMGDPISMKMQEFTAKF